jgi:hypothetical protein
MKKRRAGERALKREQEKALADQPMRWSFEVLKGVS